MVVAGDDDGPPAGGPGCPFADTVVLVAAVPGLTTPPPPTVGCAVAARVWGGRVDPSVVMGATPRPAGADDDAHEARRTAPITAEPVAAATRRNDIRPGTAGKPTAGVGPVRGTVGGASLH
jgi:hypothetical protein